MKPDAQNAKPTTPDYLRSLVAQAGLSQRQAARRLGVDERTMRHWLAGKYACPYTAQFALECLAEPDND